MARRPRLDRHAGTDESVHQPRLRFARRRLHRASAVSDLLESTVLRIVDPRRRFRCNEGAAWLLAAIRRPWLPDARTTRCHGPASRGENAPRLPQSSAEAFLARSGDLLGGV